MKNVQLMDAPWTSTFTIHLDASLRISCKQGGSTTHFAPQGHYLVASACKAQPEEPVSLLFNLQVPESTAFYEHQSMVRWF